MAQKILTPLQQDFIYFLSKNNAFKRRFYLTGGTALAAYYLGHRLSEDLDFFSKDEVEINGVNVFLKTIKDKLKIKKLDYEQTFNRNIFFIHTKKEILKTEFTYFPFEHIEKPILKDGIFIDSLTDIAANKVFTIFQNPRSRDFIDLYYILKIKKNLSFPKLIKLARTKFDTHIDPLQLGTQLYKAKDIKDLPRMIIKIDAKIWRDYFLALAQSLSSNIFK